VSDKVKEKSTLEAKTLRINKNLLHDICEILDKQHSDSLQKEKEGNGHNRVYLEYTLITKNKKIETGNSASFLKNWNAKNFKEINMYFRADEKNIHVRFGGIFERLECDVEDMDSLWVNGLIKQFEEVFEKYETKNEFFHSKQAYIIYVAIPAALLGGFFVLLGPIFPEGEIEDLPSLEIAKLVVLIAMMMVVVATSLFWGDLFHWLFPKIETEAMIQPKIRKYVLGGIGTLILSIIGSGIFSYIQSLS